MKRTEQCVAVDEIHCSACPMARELAGLSQFCPFIVRKYEAGHRLFERDSPADYAYYVMDGVVGLSSDGDRTDSVCLPGSFVGAECTTEPTYSTSATVLTAASMCGASKDGFQRWLSAREQAAQTRADNGGAP